MNPHCFLGQFLKSNVNADGQICSVSLNHQEVGGILGKPVLLEEFGVLVQG